MTPPPGENPAAPPQTVPSQPTNYRQQPGRVERNQSERRHEIETANQSQLVVMPPQMGDTVSRNGQITNAQQQHRSSFPSSILAAFAGSAHRSQTSPVSNPNPNPQVELPNPLDTQMHRQRTQHGDPHSNPSVFQGDIPPLHAQLPTYKPLTLVYKYDGYPSHTFGAPDQQRTQAYEEPRIAKWPSSPTPMTPLTGIQQAQTAHHPPPQQPLLSRHQAPAPIQTQHLPKYPSPPSAHPPPPPTRHPSVTMQLTSSSTNNPYPAFPQSQVPQQHAPKPAAGPSKQPDPGASALSPTPPAPSFHPAIALGASQALKPIHALYEQVWTQLVKNVQSEMSRMHSELTGALEAERKRTSVEVQKVVRAQEEQRRAVFDECQALRREKAALKAELSQAGTSLKACADEVDRLKLTCQKLEAENDVLRKMGEGGFTLREAALQASREDGQTSAVDYVNATMDSIRAEFGKQLEAKVAMALQEAQQQRTLRKQAEKKLSDAMKQLRAITEGVFLSNVGEPSPPLSEAVTSGRRNSEASTLVESPTDREYEMNVDGLIDTSVHAHADRQPHARRMSIMSESSEGPRSDSGPVPAPVASPVDHGARLKQLSTRVEASRAPSADRRAESSSRRLSAPSQSSHIPTPRSSAPPPVSAKPEPPSRSPSIRPPSSSDGGRPFHSPLLPSPPPKSASPIAFKQEQPVIDLTALPDSTAVVPLRRSSPSPLSSSYQVETQRRGDKDHTPIPTPPPSTGSVSSASSTGPKAFDLPPIELPSSPHTVEAKSSVENQSPRHSERVQSDSAAELEDATPQPSSRTKQVEDPSLPRSRSRSRSHPQHGEVKPQDAPPDTNDERDIVRSDEHALPPISCVSYHDSLKTDHPIPESASTGLSSASSPDHSSSSLPPLKKPSNKRYDQGHHPGSPFQRRSTDCYRPSPLRWRPPNEEERRARKRDRAEFERNQDEDGRHGSLELGTECRSQSPAKIRTRLQPSQPTPTPLQSQNKAESTPAAPSIHRPSPALPSTETQPASENTPAKALASPKNATLSLLSRLSAPRDEPEPGFVEPPRSKAKREKSASSREDGELGEDDVPSAKTLIRRISSARPPRKPNSTSGGPPRSARNKIGINHLDILYDSSRDRMVCRMCLSQEKDAKNPAPPVSFPPTATWPELIGHCQSSHPKSCEELEKLSPGQVAELRQRMSSSKVSGFMLI